MAKIIMVVDDSSSVRQMIAFTLAQAGYDVVEAVDGRDGISKLDGLKVSLIVTDLNVPNVNGNELIKTVRGMHEYKYLPIIVLTTESHSDKKQESKRAGATGWITKPFKPDQLLGVVQKIMP